MAILFDWYENPKPTDKQDEEQTLHPRIRLNGSTTTTELKRYIQEACSLTETDVVAVLDALSHYLGRELREGRRVHLDGIGYFYPTLTCSDKVTVNTRRKSTYVELKDVSFRMDKGLRSEIGVIKVKPLKQRNLSQGKLTAEEIDKRVVKFLETHDFITRSDLQSLCDMTRTTASRHILRLCNEGKLENRGVQRQPVYVLKTDGSSL